MCFYSAVTKTCKLLPCFAMDGHTVDGILIEGDAMYVKTFDYDTIPDAETLSLTDVFTRSSTLAYDGC